jgi:hypothetical protein
LLLRIGQLERADPRAVAERAKGSHDLAADQTVLGGQLVDQLERAGRARRSTWSA